MAERVANTVMLPASHYDAMVEALQWYATLGNWQRKHTTKGLRGVPGWINPAAHIDRGSRAAFIITQIGEAPSQRCKPDRTVTDRGSNGR